MSRARAHREDIQGLRAVAVLLVALGHAGVPGLAGGFVGVDVFFVLSGFLITGLLLDEARATGRISLAAFYVRRARRILPAALLTLAVVQITALVALNFVRAREVLWDGLAATVFASNFRFAAERTDYFADAQPPSPLLHMWSLSVEEQFYLVWPALLALVLGVAAARRTPALVATVGILACASLAWSIHLTAAVPAAAYFSPLARAWELALGAALAVAATTRVVATGGRAARLALGWGGLAAIVGAAVLLSSATPFPGYAALLPTLGAALVLWAGLGRGKSRAAVGRLLGAAPLRYVGDRSYAFYLWHWPALTIASQYLERDLSPAVNLVLLAGAFALSIASYALVENPLRRMRWSGRRTSAVFGVATACVAVSAVLSLQVANGEARRFDASSRPEPEVADAVLVVHRVALGRSPRKPAALPEVVAAVDAARRGAPIPRGLHPPVSALLDERPPYSLPAGCVPVARSNESRSKLCPLGRLSSRRTIVLLGDSHAQMWLPAVLRTAQREGWRVIPILRPGCTPATWVDARYGLSLCRSWYPWALEQVRRLRPAVTIVGGAAGGHRGAEAWSGVRGLLAAGRALRPATGSVVLVGDPEGLKRSPVDCLVSRRASMSRCTATWAPRVLRPYDSLSAGARRARIGFLDTRPWFCFERQCPPVIGRTIAYKDPHHVTAAYALRLSAVFRKALLAELG